MSYADELGPDELLFNQRVLGLRDNKAVTGGNGVGTVEIPQ